MAISTVELVDAVPDLADLVEGEEPLHEHQAEACYYNSKGRTIHCPSPLAQQWQTQQQWWRNDKIAAIAVARCGRQRQTHLIRSLGGRRQIHFQGRGGGGGGAPLFMPTWKHHPGL